MYHSHFGLREEPFGVTPDRRFFFQTEQHQEAVATLLYAIYQRRGFALLVGPPGLGKTSVLFNLVQILKGKAQIAFLANPYYNRDTVLEAILASLGLEPAASPAANHRLFYQYLLKTHAAGKTVVVIFDEAQDLGRDTLEAIRMLSNFETPEGKLLQILLAGQPRLAETLHQPDCEQIRQRLNAIARLEPLPGPDIPRYMAHRLEIAGGSLAVFAPQAVQDIAAASGGVPRNVNTLCFNALTLAYALDKRQVGPQEVAEVLRDLALPGWPTAPAPLQGVATQGVATQDVATQDVATQDVATQDVSVQGVATGPHPLGSVLRAVTESVPAGPPPSGGVFTLLKTTQSFRPAFLAGALALLAVCAFLWEHM